MARIPYLDRDDLAPEHRDVLDRDINLMRALAHSPEAARAFMGLGMFIRNTSQLDGRLRELAILQVGYLARAAYEWTHHLRIGRRFGVTDDDVHALMAESAGRESALEPLARTVLLAAREMTEDGAISDDTFATLSETMESEHLVDLVTTIAFYNAVVRLLASLQIDVEDAYLDELARFPLPGQAE
ncbi:MAG: carboxymuconolactone decarboxylase family protein [Alphaproteobacteria bacterium]|jgi:alkylhydroperoxidase family enzyme|nr:carboxymuconolactone decarboxylase family protein [Alphaproteobacteria bacterium]